MYVFILPGVSPSSANCWHPQALHAITSWSNRGWDSPLLRFISSYSLSLCISFPVFLILSVVGKTHAYHKTEIGLPA